jgi:HAD superfamily hydrolase (TIGR01509 family)
VEHTQPSATEDTDTDLDRSPGEGPPAADAFPGAAADPGRPGAGAVVTGPAAAAGTRQLTALIVDWGGVLTDPLDTAMTTWATADGVDFAHFVDVMKSWVGSSGSGPVASGGADGAGGAPAGATADAVAAGGEPTGDHARGAADGRPGGAAGARPGGAADGQAGGEMAGTGADGGSGAGGGAADDRAADDRAADPRVIAELEDAARLGLVPTSPVHALERGEISIEEFEQRLAAALAERGSVVEADGLLGRLLGGLAELRDDMLGLVRRARRSGLRTALLSNSWGDSNYPEEEWEGAFDVVVISGRVGMRKPEAEIFLHTANLLGVPPEQCVMVDDLAGNIQGAVAAGMVGVLHKSYEETAEELEILFDRTLR